MTEWELGSVVLHPQLGSGTIIALSAERVEVKFKLRGTKALAMAEAQGVLRLARAKRTPGNSAPGISPRGVAPQPVLKPKKPQTNIETTTIRCSKCGRKVPQRDASLHERVCGGVANRRKRKAKTAPRSTPGSRGQLFSKKKKPKLPSQEPRIPIVAPRTTTRLTAQEARTLPNAIPSAPFQPEYITCEACGREVKRDLIALHLKRFCPKRHYDDAPFNVSVTSLPFELLPPGTWKTDDVIKYYEHHETRSALGGQEIDKQRIVSLVTLNPIRCSVGKSKWYGYILFEFDSSLAVVLECPITRNATYILTGNWRTMVTESKRRLLTEFAQYTTRVVHKGDWLVRIKRTLQQHAASKPLLKS